MNEESQPVQVAVKRVENISSDFQKEISIMREITHPNIVRLYGLMNEGTYIYIYIWTLTSKFITAT